MRKITKIIIHCSDTPAGMEFSAADIDRWHKERGWDGIGYHYVVKLDGTIEKGREEDVTRAHCKGHNLDSIGVCYIGGRDDNGLFVDTRTKEQEEAMVFLCKQLLSKYPKAKLYGHRDFAPKECPCFDVGEWWKEAN
ncbi:N-acetylmuramoyl-L-alanine amidase [Helicobacter heilmannii]|uniref:N-acetylmuramoyl-L-alanine amidase n=1 Tax=Helicobacter heilmannii TaxID=35817 RepID=UPI0006A1BE49|nr:N-acetylmuramoyl-L-alanine amidase [Helicobacter heilmannii]CRF50413.1 N-acetylmuramoyl-L-alanine amidase [Helicobacter heilmannii]